MNTFLWGVLPYICFTLLVGGLIWRWRWDQYGWTTKSSQLNEGRMLRLSSPLFHFGILAVAGGHLMGLVFPKSLTEAVGITQHSYHLVATIGGSLAGLVTVIGLVGLLYRRLVNHSVRLATTKTDVIVYIFLILPIGLGATATVLNQVLGGTHGYDYRETISIWFRSLFYFQPNLQVMSQVPLSFKMHIVAGLLLFGLWPFTRLVHVMSAPVGYLARPEIIYRSRTAATATATPNRGWKPVRIREENVVNAVVSASETGKYQGKSEAFASGA